MKVSDLKSQLDLMPQDAVIAVQCEAEYDGSVKIEKNFTIYKVDGQDLFVLGFDRSKPKLNVVIGDN